MKLPNPKISKASYPNGKPYWLVSATVSGQRYRRKHETEQAAMQDKVRLLRSSTSGLSAREHVSTEQAVYVLHNTPNLDARGKDVLYAVEWFCKHYIDRGKVKTVRQYFDEFIAIKRSQGRREESVRELDQFLKNFVRDFEKADVTVLHYEDLEKWIMKNACSILSQKRFFRLLKHFFGYLSGDSQYTPNPQPILKNNPFKGHEIIYQNDGDDDTDIVIFTADECDKLLQEAQRHNGQRTLAWLLFTGMRPEETMRFWTDERWGWNSISDDLKYIRVAKAVSKTRRNRIIEVSPTLKAWLECYRKFPSLMTFNWAIKYGRIRRAVLPVEKLKPDVPRHTLISMMIKDGKGWAEIELQMGNKKAVQMRHYASLITAENEVKSFYGLTPDKFTPDLPEKDYQRGLQEKRMADLKAKALNGLPPQGLCVA